MMGKCLKSRSDLASAPMALIDKLHRLLPPFLRPDIPVVPVVRLSGTIGMATPLKPGLMLSSVSRALERAFSISGARAVALAINSPGGSPSQSHLIFRRIRALAEEKSLPVYAFIEDVGGTFGFVELMHKLGIERRVYTAGERKVMLDPFQPEKPEDVARIKAVQADMHANFIALVKARRGARLAGSDDTLFSGEFWTANRAIELGLADRIGDLRSAMRERYGEKVRLRLIEGDRSLLGRRLAGVGGALSTEGLADDVISAAEARALWSRYGL